jgi:hypothetical protein
VPEGLAHSILSKSAEGARRLKSQIFGSGRRMPITLFLVPEAGLRAYYAAHLIMARVLQENGHKAVILSCNGLILMCSAKFALGVKPTAVGDTENAACAACISTARDVGAKYGISSVTIESLVDSRDRFAIESTLDQYRGRLREARFDEIGFGAAAYGEVLRAQRRQSIDEFTPADHKLLEAVLQSSLLTYLAVKRLTSENAISRIVYFGDYAIWMGPYLIAKAKGIPLSSLDHAFNRDVDRRLIGLRPGNAILYVRSQIANWAEYSNRPLTPETVAKIVDGALYRLSAHGGTSTYSPNWTVDNQRLFDDLGLSRNRKTIVAYPSSDDETLCIREFMKILGHEFQSSHRPFNEQDDWLHALIDWIGLRKNLQLIVRVHPRLAALYRHGTVATQAGRMKREFAQIPENVVMVWPESSISSYNLGEIADVAAVGTSTIGLELARFGVPVVAAFPGFGPFPTGSFVRYAANSTGYFGELEAALTRPASFEAIREAIRWTYFVHWSPFVDVSDLVPSSDYWDVPPWRKPREIETILKVLRDGEDLSAINMKRLPSGEAAVQSEDAAVRSAIKQLIVFFMSGNSDPGVGLGAIRASDDGLVIAEIDGKEVRRYAPLVNRLAPLLALEEVDHVGWDRRWASPSLI